MKENDSLDGGSVPEPVDAFALRETERYTMTEAATIKGVSYHTVSRAVRQGRLPVTRLGRMALITGQELANWEPMRERAPRRHRQEPKPIKIHDPALDEAIGGRIEIARRLATMFEIIHTASSELSLEVFGQALANRFTVTFGLTRASLWVIRTSDGSNQRLASVGPAFSSIPDTSTISATFTRMFAAIDLGNARISLAPQTEFAESSGASAVLPKGPLLIVPLRVRNHTIGTLFGDRQGERLDLDEDHLALAQVLGNQIALAVDHAMLRQEQRFRINQLSAILDQMGDQVRACDTDGRLNLINRTDKIFNSGEGGPTPAMGSDALANAGVAARRELDGTLIDRDRHPLARALRGESVTDWEYDVERADGRVQRALVSARPIVVDGDITGAVYIGRNISAARERERHDQERLASLERARRRADALITLIASPAAASEADAMGHALEGLRGALSSGCGLALVLDGAGRLAPAVSTTDPDGLPVLNMDDPIAMSTTILAFSRRAAVITTRNDTGRAELELMTALGAETLLVAPVQIDRQPVGALYLFHEDQDAFDANDQAFSTAAGNLCARSIECLRLRAALDRTGSG